MGEHDAAEVYEVSELCIFRSFPQLVYYNALYFLLHIETMENYHTAYKSLTVSDISKNLLKKLFEELHTNILLKFGKSLGFVFLGLLHN